MKYSVGVDRLLENKLDMAKVQVLECQSGVAKKTGNAYNIALVRTDGRVGKVFSDVPLQVSDREIEVQLVLAPNTEMFLTPRIKAIVQK